MNTTETRNVSRVAVFAIDAGNRFIKFIDRRGNPHRLPSYTKKLEPWQDQLEPDSHSVTLEIEGTRYVVGRLAKELGGKPSFLGNKAQLAHLLVLSGIEPFEGSEIPLLIERLVLALPDSRNPENLSHLKQLEGVKTITRNGVTFTYSIRKVVAIDECVGAYRFAINGNLFNYPLKTNAIIDCGGGTTLGKIFTQSGQINRDGDIVLPGTANLARAIATSLTPKLGYSPELDLILDGIGEGTFTLGTTDINFKKEFIAAHETWIEDIRSRIRAAWQPYFNQIAEVLIVGGSAPLLQPLEVSSGGRFKVAISPQFMGIKGMVMGGK